MTKKYYCPLLEKEISEGKCLDINYELTKAKKEEELKVLRKILKKTSDEIEKVCEKCSNNPL